MPTLHATINYPDDEKSYQLDFESYELLLAHLAKVLAEETLATSFDFIVTSSNVKR